MFENNNEISYYLFYKIILQPELISDVRAVLKVGFLFLPLPVFWALYDQQGSRWTFQAAKMNLDLGPFGYLKPDQIQSINAFLILAFIPLFDMIVYPILDKLRIPNRSVEGKFHYNK